MATLFATTESSFRAPRATGKALVVSELPRLERAEAPPVSRRRFAYSDREPELFWADDAFLRSRAPGRAAPPELDSFGLPLPSLRRYLVWLAHEHRAALVELQGSDTAMFFLPNEEKDLVARISDLPPSTRIPAMVYAGIL